MKNEYIGEYRRLKQAGWDIQKQPAARMNGGSETDAHFVAKAVGLKLCLSQGFHADTEVEGPQGEIDLLCIAPDKINRAIEFETDPDGDTIADKKQRYVDSNAVIEDIHVVNVAELPSNLYDLRDRLTNELGFL